MSNPVSNMGNLEKLGILVIVILVVVVGVVAITPKDRADNLFDPNSPPVTPGALDPLPPPLDGPSATDPNGTPPLDPNAAWPLNPGGANNADIAEKPIGGGGVGAGVTPDNMQPGPAPAPVVTPTFKEVTIASRDTLSVIAKRELGAASRWPEILAMNPGLDPKRMKNGQVIKVPLRADAPTPVVVDVNVPGVNVPGVNVPGVPTPIITATTTPVTKAKTYVVQTGDTLTGIARSQLGSASKVSALKSANEDQLKGSDRILKGMTLKLPGTASTESPAPAAGKTARAPTDTPLAGNVYTVASGDTLSSISSRLLGSSSRYREIMKANESVLHGSDKLHVGMTLTIPTDVAAK